MLEANQNFDSFSTVNPDSPFVVMKFGGRSVASSDNWEAIYEVLVERIDNGLTPVVVHSALAGVSNCLEQLIETSSQEKSKKILSDIESLHYRLGQELGVVPDDIEGHLQALHELVDGVRLVGEATPRVYARIMATGELLSTCLGASYLASKGLNAHWKDARTILTSTKPDNEQDRSRFLSASCDYSSNAKLQHELKQIDGFIITQGFIASNDDGETVLLGRGGSDTSAAYLAAQLEARRLEIWTDVPGFFSADPKAIPTARLLRELDYSEAQEIASAGGGILHPRSISPVRQSGIPLFLRCTGFPEWGGTAVHGENSEGNAQVKAISQRSGLTLISMESMDMWHQVGFLANVFDCFRNFGISVDLISTSESNITVSIDENTGIVESDILDEVVGSLEELCKVSVIRDCSAITLVGQRIRTILHELTPVFETFEEHKVHLLTQAANDLNLTFVVGAEHGYSLLQKLHGHLVKNFQEGVVFGPTWQQICGITDESLESASPWWSHKRKELLSIGNQYNSVYVYHADSVRSSITSLQNLDSIDSVFYAMKANSNVEILQIVSESNANFECVSPGEIERVLKVAPDLDRKRILFTPNFSPKSEYIWAFERGVWVTLDNLYPIREWPEVFANQDIFIRIDTGQGRGHHEHVRTAGSHSKFGIPLFELDELKTLVSETNVNVVGLHAHTGSGILTPNNWEEIFAQLISVKESFLNVRFINIGGGFGIPEKPNQHPLNLEDLDRALLKVKNGINVKLWIEPGRFIVGGAGVLLTRVNQIKGKGEMRYLGVDTGMNSLIRPALYGAYHEIINLTRYEDSADNMYTVVGPICETGDRLGSDRMLPETQEGDMLLIANAGAYGYVMSSHYNLRGPASEIVV
ncbi:MAG: diaminopimelate decarboxylase [Rhodospirillaceae bacterium]|nr:diaminopimelate decarboxylase [Rhodospirillaceae bacterium]